MSPHRLLRHRRRASPCASAMAAVIIIIMAVGAATTAGVMAAPTVRAMATIAGVAPRPSSFANERDLRRRKRPRASGAVFFWELLSDPGLGEIPHQLRLAATARDGVEHKAREQRNHRYQHDAGREHRGR